MFEPSLAPPLSNHGKWAVPGWCLAVMQSKTMLQHHPSSCLTLDGFFSKLLLSSSHWRALQPPLAKAAGHLGVVWVAMGVPCLRQIPSGMGGGGDFCRSTWREMSSGGRYQDLCASLEWHDTVRSLEHALGKDRNKDLVCWVSAEYQQNVLVCCASYDLSQPVRAQREVAGGG